MYAKMLHAFNNSLGIKDVVWRIDKVWVSVLQKYVKMMA
jgi:hypothetical protein